MSASTALLASCTPLVPFIEKYSGTVTEGDYEPDFYYRGFITGVVGVRSPTTLTDGKTLAGVYDTNNPSDVAVLSISGFSGDPGTTYLERIVVGAATRLRSDASYSYSSGTASWSWSTQFGLDGSGTSSVSIIGPP